MALPEGWTRDGYAIRLENKDRISTIVDQLGLASLGDLMALIAERADEVTAALKPHATEMIMRRNAERRVRTRMKAQA